MLACGRWPLRDPADGQYGRSRNGRAQRRHVPHAGLRRPYDGHALACPQDRSAPLRRLQASGPPDARFGRAGRRSRLYLRRDGSDARQHGRIPAGRVPAPSSGEVGEVRYQRYLCSGRLRLRDRGLCRSGRREGGRGAFRRPYGLLFARRPLSAFPCHGPDPPPRCGLSGYGRRHPAAGGRMDRPRDGADLSRPDPHGPAARSP